MSPTYTYTIHNTLPRYHCTAHYPAPLARPQPCQPLPLTSSSMNRAPFSLPAVLIAFLLVLATASVFHSPATHRSYTLTANTQQCCVCSCAELQKRCECILKNHNIFVCAPRTNAYSNYVASDAVAVTRSTCLLMLLSHKII